LRLADQTYLDEAGFLECCISTVLIDRLDRLGTKLHLYVASQLRNVDALGVKIGRDTPLDHLRYVTTDSTFFLGETGTVDSTTDTDTGTSDTAYSGHCSCFD